MPITTYVSIKRQLADALVARLSLITAFKSVDFDRVRIKLDSYRDHELPAIQIIDLGCAIQHEMSQIRKIWTIDIEMVFKSNADMEINQRDVWDMELEIERAIGERPNFGIPRILHLRYLGNQTDLHLIGPFYSARMTFEALFTEPFTREC